MTKIWKIKNKIGAGAIDYTQDPEQSLDFSGEFLNPDIFIPSFRWVDNDDESGLPVEVRRSLDFIVFKFDTLVIREDAWSKIGSFLSNEIQAFEIEVDSRKYFLLNVINVINCLDRDNSDLQFLSNGNIGRIKWAVLREEMVNGSMVFKIPENRYTSIYASEDFKRLVEYNGLTGLDFVDINFRY